MKLVTNKLKSGGLHEKHVVATWNFGNRLSFAYRPRETKKNLKETKKNLIKKKTWKSRKTFGYQHFGGIPYTAITEERSIFCEVIVSANVRKGSFYEYVCNYE